MIDLDDFEACYAAVRSRDRRFDGRFVTGVLSTGIYCRPSCPARTPKAVNVRFFPSPAAAQNDGLRACRRCRPELAPDQPGWDVDSELANRVLRLIDDGAADDGVEALADRVHVSPRHLQRLLKTQFGATPAQLAKMRRVRVARMLVDQTDLPLTRVAFAAGFGSVRQFNDSFKTAFQTTPSALRRAGRHRDPAATEITLHLQARSPFAGQHVVNWFDLHLLPGLERVDDRGTFWRVLPDAGEVGFHPNSTGVDVTIDPLASADLRPVVSLARRLFDLEADLHAIAAELQDDALLAPAIAAVPGIRIPGVVDGFEGAVRAILGQQVTTAAAITLSGRLVELGGGRIPDAEDLRLTDLGEALGIPRQRAKALRVLAAAVDEGLDLSPSAEVGATTDALLALPGIGPWTAGVVGLRCLGHPDAWPSGDVALVKISRRMTGTNLSSKDLDRIAERWRPWRAYAAMWLWHTYLNPQILDAAEPEGHA